MLVYIEKSTRKLCLYAIKNLKMKGSWDVFLFNTEKSTKEAVLTEKGYKLRMTRDEGRETNDEGRGTRDE